MVRTFIAALTTVLILTSTVAPSAAFPMWHQVLTSNDTIKGR